MKLFHLLFLFLFTISIGEVSSVSVYQGRCYYKNYKFYLGKREVGIMAIVMGVRGRWIGRIERWRNGEAEIMVGKSCGRWI